MPTISAVAKQTESSYFHFSKDGCALVIDSDKNLITDHYNTNQISNFKENRHDQSILSLLSKKFGGVILKNETFFLIVDGSLLIFFIFHEIIYIQVY